MAFLRGINVGGHTVTNAQLREVLEGLGYADAGTFIASGNLIFRSSKKPTTLEREISTALRSALGYDVATFVRTDAEVAAVAAFDPFPGEAREGDTLHVGFLKEPVAADVADRVAALSGSVELLRVEGRELYWLIHGKLMDSAVGDRAVLKALGAETTLRNVNTIRRMAAKFPPAG